MTDIGTGRAVRLALPPFLAGKAIALVVAYLTAWSNWPETGFPSLFSLRDAFSSWDGENYRSIARSGYPEGPLSLKAGDASHLWGFFPGLPMLAHALSWLLVDVVLSAAVVNTVCELVALVFLIKLVHLERGDEETAQTAAWLLALYPYAIFMTVFYTEAPFLAAATAALYFMRRAGEGDHARACVAGAMAMTVRLTGVALVLPLLYERLARRRGRPDWQLLLVALVPLPLLLFGLYARARTGDALAYSTIQNQSESYGMKHIVGPWSGFQTTWDSAGGLIANQYGYVFRLEALFGLLAIGLVALQWATKVLPMPRIPPSLCLYSTGVLLPPICLTFWAAIPRYLMTMVPLYLLGADLLRGRERWRLPVIAVSGALMAYGTSVLFSGRYLA